MTLERVQKEAFNRTVRVCMAKQGIKTQSQLAARIGMGESSLSERLHFKKEWSMSEFRRLIKVLRPDDAELLTMVRGA